jgi:hypothetical protein
MVLVGPQFTWVFRFRFPPFFSAIFKPTRRKSGHSPDPARLVSDSGTKAAPLLGSGNRGRAILSVSYKNVSAALSFLNKVYKSIDSRLTGWTFWVTMRTRTTGRSCPPWRSTGTRWPPPSSCWTSAASIPPATIPSTPCVLIPAGINNTWPIINYLYFTVASYSTCLRNYFLKWFCTNIRAFSYIRGNLLFFLT